MLRSPRPAGLETTLAALVVALLLGTLAGCAASEKPFVPEVQPLPDMPLGLQTIAMDIPADNPMTPEKVALGWQLFYDPRLSADDSIACATCHIAMFGYGDPDAVSLGVNNARGRRNSNPVLNSAFNASQFWDGRASTLEDQALGPLTDPMEMANTLLGVEIRLNRIPAYREQFAAVFGSEEITAANVARALAAFQRVIIAGNSPWDRYTVNGEQDAVSDAARRGFELFSGKAGCSRCHSGANFTDSGSVVFHNTGFGMRDAKLDLGRFEVTGEEADRGAFKTPTLRNVAQTAPYMHDGSIATLEEIIDFYDAGGLANEWLDPLLGVPLGLTPEEKADLLEFLRALTGEVVEWAGRAPALPPDIEEPY